MKRALDEGAAAASAALGLNVLVHDPQDTISADCTRYVVEVRTTSKPVKCMCIRPYLNDLCALVYLEGLVAGATLTRSRHQAGTK